MTLKVLKNQTTRFTSAKFQKLFPSCFIMLRIQRLVGYSVDPDEVAHYEALLLNLQCLRTQLHFICSALTLKLPETKLAEFANSVDPGEVAHHEPPHIDLRCLLSSF